MNTLDYYNFGRMAVDVTYQSGGHHLLKPLGLGLIVQIHTAHQVIPWNSNTSVFSSQGLEGKCRSGFVHHKDLNMNPGGAQKSSAT